MRDAQLIINRAALLHNLQLVKQYAPHSKVLAMVKANAYGHGALIIAQTLEPHVDALGVAFLAEAVALREAGIRCPIAILEGVFTPEELTQALDLGCYLVVHQAQQLDLLADYQGQHKTSIWFKIDSGMHRLGFLPQEAIPAYQRLQTIDCVRELILTSHFACADDLSSDKTREQLAVLDALHLQLHALARSFANSAAILAWPQSHHQWVRPGIMLYGSSPFATQTANDLQLQAVMHFQTKLIAIKHIAAGETVGYGSTWRADRATRLGVIAVGYGDGYPRHIQTGTPVLINGQRAPIVGRVSMDMLTVDITDIEAEYGDTVILWGDTLSIDEIATYAHTISYELACQITTRVERIIL
ncbi:alanine racemase [Agitococcus lubricus]|uniref:Alanine racemase n=1 Tax=Agitococcus lubricus TaxID=1077255 RepID=A0A2T5IYT7_9GAMM|nr:alanine racemase [Agitococcus lubricus]PTQ89170.1 alanine racemase [Agitococcus lubricus]